MMERMKSLCAILLALILLAAPVTAFASPAEQQGALDPGTLTAIEDAAALVFAITGTPGSVVATDAPVDEPVDEPVDDPVDGPVTDLPIFDVSEVAVYEHDDFTVELPVTWPVDDSDPGTLSVEDRDALFSLQIESLGDSAPGLIYIPIFESQMSLLISSFGEGAESLPPTRFVSADGLPGLRIAIINAEDPEFGSLDGAIYIIPTGDSAYGAYAVGASETWPLLEAAVDEAVYSIAFAPDIVTIQTAGDEGLTLVAPDESFSFELAPGWYGSTTNDDRLMFAIADPDVNVVGAGGMAVTADAGDETMTALIEAIGGALDPEQGADMIAAILEQMDMGSSFNVEIDDSLTAVFPSELQEVLGIIRIVGDAPIEDMGTMPITLYLSVYADRVGTFVFFGDAEQVTVAEETILDMLDSVTILE